MPSQLGPAETTGVVIVAVGLLRVLEVAIAKLSNKNDSSKVGFGLCVLGKEAPGTMLMKELCKHMEEVRRATHDLTELHSPKDQDGIPLWYMPRSWEDTQKEILTELRTLNKQMGALVKNGKG